MALQTTFSRGEWGSVELPPLPDDFNTELATLSPRVRYLAEYGWKQSLSDAFAGAKTADEFNGKLKARFDAILAGTVKSPSSSGGRGPQKTPLEKEIIRLAGLVVFPAIERVEKKSGKKMAKDTREAYVTAYITAHRDELEEQATANIARDAEIAEESEVDLDALLASVETDETE